MKKIMILIAVFSTPSFAQTTDTTIHLKTASLVNTSSCSFIYSPKSEYDKNTVIKALDSKGWSLNDSSAKFKFENTITDSSCYDLQRAATCSSGGDYICLAHTKIRTNIEETQTVRLPKPRDFIKTTDCVTGDNVGEIAQRAEENFPKVISSQLAMDAFELPDCWNVDETMLDTYGEIILASLYKRYIEKSGYFDSKLFYRLLMNENIKLDSLKKAKANLLFFLIQSNDEDQLLNFLNAIQKNKRFSGLWNVNEKLPVENYFVYEAPYISNKTLLKLLVDFKPNKSDILASLVRDSIGNSLCIRHFSDNEIYSALQILGGVTSECEKNKTIENDLSTSINNWRKNKLKKDSELFRDGIFNYKANRFAALIGDKLSVYDISGFPQKKLLYEFDFKTIKPDPKISYSYDVDHINFNQDGNIILGLKLSKSYDDVNSDRQILFIDVTNKKSTRVQLQNNNNEYQWKVTYSPAYKIANRDSDKIIYYGLIRSTDDSPIVISGKKLSGSLDFVTCLTQALCILNYHGYIGQDGYDWTYSYDVKTGTQTEITKTDVTGTTPMSFGNPYTYDRSGDLGVNPLASKPVIYLSKTLDNWRNGPNDTKTQNWILGGFFDMSSLSFKDVWYYSDLLKELRAKTISPYIIERSSWIAGKNIFVQEIKNTKPFTNDYLNKFVAEYLYFLYYDVYTVDATNSIKKICTLPYDSLALGGALVDPSIRPDILKYNSINNKLLIWKDSALLEVDCND